MPPALTIPAVFRDPLLFLGVLILITLVAFISHRIVRSRHKRRVRAIAAEWGMRYAQADLFRLASRVVGRLPVPGAADIRVLDVVYATQGECFRYVFTVEYTRGVTDYHRREARAVTFVEPREGTRQPPEQVVCAPGDLPLIQQYRHLRSQWSAPCDSTPEQSGAI
jgi:hypothetical protein